MGQDCWEHLTEPVLLKIFDYLSPIDILNAGRTCSYWNRICYDNMLWRSQFCKKYGLDHSTVLCRERLSWYEEYKRLNYHTPLVETEVLKSHSKPVLHVTFSHNGKYFVTCSMDGYVLVWNSSYPASIKYSYDMKRFTWKYCLYSEFNESDTLLLISGVHFGKNEDTSGEIAVFSLDDDMTLICRIFNKPYDVFGTFYSEEHIFSGKVQHIANSICCCSIWVHKAYPDVTSEHKPLMSRLFRFMNVNSSCIRTLSVSKCRNEPSQIQSETTIYTVNRQENVENLQQDDDSPPWFIYNSDYMNAENTSGNNSDTEWTKSDSVSHSEISSESEEELDSDTDEDLTSQPDKYLIFSTGSKTNIPHQIGIKRIGKISFPKKLDPGPSLAERIAECRKRAERAPVLLNHENVDILSRNFDSVDHLIEFNGHVSGMKLSPDHRFLYVTCRPWPENYVVVNPLDRPPISTEVDIHVIDLTTFKEVGRMLKIHKKFARDLENNLMFLDVSNDYVASGCKDKGGFLWDRHYGIGLSRLNHDDVVNSVAFNPRNSETLITVSDDSTIKIWRSRCQAAKLLNGKVDYPKDMNLSPGENTSERKIGKKYRVFI